MRIVYFYGWFEEEVSCGGVGGIDAGAAPTGWVKGRSRGHECEEEQ